MSSGFFSSHFSFAHSFIGCAGSYVYVCIYQMYTGRSEHKHIRNRDENTLWAIICNEEYESCELVTCREMREKIVALEEKVRKNHH